MREEKTLTGLPSIDRPWTKYYSDIEKNLQIPSGSMYDYLFEQNRAYPDDIALQYYGHQTTYQTLFTLIDKCCRNLTALGVKKGDIVTVQAISLPQVVVLVYALTRIGACGNMLYPDAKAKDVVSSMEKTQSRLLVVMDLLYSSYEEDLPDSFDNTVILLNVADQMAFIPGFVAKRKASYSQKNKKVHTLPWNTFISGDGIDYQENHDGSIPAFMIRTGGTTGIPKEVVLCSTGFNAIAQGVYYSNMGDGWTRQKHNVLLLPPFIAFGIGSGIHHSLCFGMKTIIVLDASPFAISKLFKKFRPDYIMAGTVQVEQMVKDFQGKNISLNNIKVISIGGDGMSSANEEKLRNSLRSHHCNVNPLKGYGMTETSGGVTVETRLAQRKGSVGIPIALFNIKIVDPETNQELSYNTPGEICLSSPGIMLQYYKNPAATDEIIDIIDSVKWLHTGDIGEISEDGLLSITGRIKRIIVCKEGLIYHKVFPLLIEDQLEKLPGVREISIVGKPHEVAGNVLVAYVVPSQQASFDQIEKTLREYCSSHLESFERPTNYICLQALPRTMIGKVDFRALEEMAKQL